MVVSRRDKQLWRYVIPIHAFGTSHAALPSEKDIGDAAGWALLNVGAAGRPAPHGPFEGSEHASRRRDLAGDCQEDPNQPASRHCAHHGMLLSAWLIYFFAINLFVKQLNAVTVPYVEAPLGAYLWCWGRRWCSRAAVYLLFGRSVQVAAVRDEQPLCPVIAGKKLALRSSRA
jgi:hypothetical protein